MSGYRWVAQSIGVYDDGTAAVEIHEIDADGKDRAVCGPMRVADAARLIGHVNLREEADEKAEVKS